MGHRFTTGPTILGNGGACWVCKVFKGEQMPDYLLWCMYCIHDAEKHPRGDACKCSREDIYPAELLEKLNRLRHPASRAGAQTDQGDTGQSQPRQSHRHT